MYGLKKTHSCITGSELWVLTIYRMYWCLFKQRLSSWHPTRLCCVVSETSVNFIQIYMCVCVCMYVYTHTHTHTQQKISHYWLWTLTENKKLGSCDTNTDYNWGMYMPYCCPCHNLFCRPVLLGYIFCIALGMQSSLTAYFSTRKLVNESLFCYTQHCVCRSKLRFLL